ncbi:MAG: Mycothiol acetyltransferase [Pseudidiomarina mangrovi]|nr:MAG: Mycothiol acetyltransferase [Pseudidiomarina mangrovi]
MTAISIRPAIHSDIAAIAALERAYYGDHGYPSALFYQALQQWPQGLWVASEQQLIGYLLVAPSEPQQPHWLMSMLVAHAARGRGVGHKLLQHFLATELNVNQLRLTVAADNHAAQRLYQQCGFEKIDDIADFFGPGEHRWLYEWQR